MEKIKVHDKTFVPYLKDEELQEIVKDVALKIYEDYKDEVPVFVGVLNGVFMFFSDLMKHYPEIVRLHFFR
jgi:hypoxanthine phosphoribosyltransferase